MKSLQGKPSIIRSICPSKTQIRQRLFLSSLVCSILKIATSWYGLHTTVSMSAFYRFFD